LNKDKKIPVRKDSHKALVDFAMTFRVFQLAFDWHKSKVTFGLTKFF
jgi:hypothetical protein